MNPIVWGVAMLVVLPLLQLPLILYLSRRVEADEESLSPVGWGDGVYPPDPNVARSADHESSQASTAERSPPSTSPEPTAPDPSAPSTVVCRQCNAANDPAFTYCHDCVARL